MRQCTSFDTVLLETRHVKAALPAMAIKIGCRDAPGIAQLLRHGVGSACPPQVGAFARDPGVAGRSQQMQIKAMDLEQTLRGLLCGFGLKVGDMSWGKLPR